MRFRLEDNDASSLKLSSQVVPSHLVKPFVRLVNKDLALKLSVVLEEAVE